MLNAVLRLFATRLSLPLSSLRMNDNPFASPRVLSSVDNRKRNQCPACLQPLSMLRAATVAWQYSCPKCSSPLVIYLPLKRRIQQLLPAILLLLAVILHFADAPTWAVSLSFYGGFLIVVANALFVPCKFGRLVER